jgi:hypothetical protein
VIDFKIHRIASLRISADVTANHHRARVKTTDLRFFARRRCREEAERKEYPIFAVDQSLDLTGFDHPRQR